MGFLSFVQRQEKALGEEARIFEDIKIPEKGGISLNFSKYFARYMKAIGLKRDKLAFHSFRHNFVQAMRDARIDRERMDALDGRITGYREGSNTRRNYGRAFTPKDLYEDLCKIEFNLDLSHLYVHD